MGEVTEFRGRRCWSIEENGACRVRYGVRVHEGCGMLRKNEGCWEEQGVPRAIDIGSSQGDGC